MKLSELGLKTKPSTKYFDGGYIAFSTRNKELLFTVKFVTKKSMGSIMSGYVRDQQNLKDLLAIKSVNQATEVISQ